MCDLDTDGNHCHPITCIHETHPKHSQTVECQAKMNEPPKELTNIPARPSMLDVGFKKLPNFSDQPFC